MKGKVEHSKEKYTKKRGQGMWFLSIGRISESDGVMLVAKSVEQRECLDKYFS